MYVQGIQNLGDFAITSGAIYVGDWVAGFDGINGLLAQFRFSYGSGGTYAKAYLQTSVDGGDSAIDIACVALTTAGETQVINLNAATSKTTQVAPSDGALTDDSAIDGILGDRFRVKVITSGTYVGTLLSVRVHPRG